jgi:hypothetical protein
VWRCAPRGRGFSSRVSVWGLPVPQERHELGVRASFVDSHRNMPKEKWSPHMRTRERWKRIKTGCIACLIIPGGLLLATGMDTYTTAISEDWVLKETANFYAVASGPGAVIEGYGMAVASPRLLGQVWGWAKGFAGVWGTRGSRGQTLEDRTRLR